LVAKASSVSGGWASAVAVFGGLSLWERIARGSKTRRFGLSSPPLLSRAIGCALFSELRAALFSSNGLHSS